MITNNSPNVAILMATYNGSKFLAAQIESIINQTYKKWKLYICDDSSTDNSVEIIDSYCAKDKRITRILFDKKKQGAKYTFAFLLEHIESSYYMFSDQDDIWIKDKVEKSINGIVSLEINHHDIPIVLHTDLKVVDKNLQTIHSSFWKSSKLNPNILNNFNYLGICNCATGCTMIFNEKAKQLSTPFPDNIEMHDWWVTLIAAKYGIVEAINDVTILYRQHGSNVVGARNIGLLYFLRKLQNIKMTIEGHRKQYEFLQLAKWGNWYKFYKYKILYTIKRNIINLY